MQRETDPAHAPEVALDQLLVAAQGLQGMRARRDDLDRAHARWRLMREIAAAGRTVAELARCLPATRAEVQPLTDALVLDGLARYEPNPAPRRAQRIALTDQGARALAAVDASARAWLRASSPAHGPAGIEGTRRFLLTVIACADTVAESSRRSVERRERPRH